MNNGVVLSGEELCEAGFKSFNAANVTTLLPSSSIYPVAFVVLDVLIITQRHHRPAEHEAWSAGPAGPGPSSGNRAQRNRLVPVFTNSCCRTYFNIQKHADYVAVIKKLLKRDPMLTFALQKAVQHLKAGDQKGVNHVTPDPSGQSSSLYGLRLTPCVWREESGPVLPALMIEHNLPYDPDVVMPRLMRDYAVLSHVPAILTLIDFHGKVLYQNASSLEYMGDLLNVKYDTQLSEGLLQVLYMFDMGSLEQMLEDVLSGDEWQGVVQVPYSLRRHLARQQDSDTIIDIIKYLGQGNQRGGVHGGVHGAGNTAEDDDETDEEFQIGDSRLGKQRQRGAAFLLKHPAKGSLAVRALPGGVAASGNSIGSNNGADDAFAVEPRRTSAVHGDRSASATAAQEMAPGMQQRKFMTLLDKASASTTPTTNAPHRHVSETELEEELGEEERLLRAVDEDSDEGLDDAALHDQECYHEVHAIPLLDPVLDKQVIMLVQTDVTPRVELENKLADLTDAQLSMLEQLFPRHIIEFMLARVPSKAGKNLRELANTHDRVMVLFCDVVGFTSMSKEVQASQVMHFLNELYEAFDDLVDDYGMYKLDIVGDCYIVVAGLIKEDQDGFVCVDELDEDQVASNAVRIMQFAKAMLREAQPVVMPHNNQPVSLRIGIHTGPLVSGLVGSKMPKFTLFGDTMNTSSRMESTCRPGCVHVSDAFAKLLPHEDWESTGGVEVKGKGLMETFLWVPSKDRQELLDLSVTPRTSLRKALTHTQSFSSAKTRHTVRSMARSTSRARRDSTASDSNAVSNPLMTILTNIRGGGDDGSGDGMGDGTSGGGTSSLRPKSGRVRGGGARSREQRMSAAGTGDADDSDTRRTAGSAAGSTVRRGGKSDTMSMQASSRLMSDASSMPVSDAVTSGNERGSDATRNARLSRRQDGPSL